EGAQDKHDTDLIARLQAGARADAQAADLSALVSFAYGGRYSAELTGADPVQMHAYREAYLRIIEEAAPGQSASPRDLISRLATLGPAEPAMTAQQQHDADALVRQIMDAWHRRLHP